ncbi:MAG: thiamine ABC transporter substrate-binding protein [Treponema sp.]|nr:thiamine ABC transporter substrate-binding protein [Treponema sp.]
MKKSFVFLNSLILLMALSFVSCSKKNSSDAAETESKEVTVYTYDSFISEWGPGPEMARLFEEKTGISVNWVDCGDGAQILSKAISEKNAPQSDVILGLDNNLVQKAREAGILEAYKPAGTEKIISGLEDALGGDWILTPYDYSHFAMIIDTESDISVPTCLMDLTKEEYAGKVIIMDPRTSTPGLGFAAWTMAVFGDNYLDFWKNFKKSVLSMSPGWSSGYGLFTKGEAPLCTSYTTSPAYHVEYGEGNRFQAVVFDEGHVEQVEGAGLTKGTKNVKAAKAFLDFLVSDEAQNTIPLTQWMFPANKNVALPESYKVAAPVPGKTLSYDATKLDSVVKEIIDVISK